MLKWADYQGTESFGTKHIVQIIDDAFEEKIKFNILNNEIIGSDILEIKAIIMCYKCKNLNVEKNLLIHMKQILDYFDFSISDQIDWYEKKLQNSNNILLKYKNILIYYKNYV